MIGRVTLLGEDETGKKLSASADILMYLYDYGPYPVVPASGPPGPDDTCVFDTLTSYWTGFCP